MPDHPLFARFYDRLLAGTERAGLTEMRRRLLSSASGRVLELGAGTGQATGPMLRAGALVTSVEPGAALVDRLRTRWPAATVHVGTAESVLLPAAAFDLAVGRVLGHRTPQNSCRTSKIKRARRWPGGDQGCTGDIDSTGSNTLPQLSPTTQGLDQ